MKVIEPGHIYQLQHLDGSGAGILVFVNREPGTEHEGVQTQEILRALIDRTQHCDSCLRWDGNDEIIKHLRMALALHEARALLRKTEKGRIEPEKVSTAHDGHFVLIERGSSEPVPPNTIGRPPESINNVLQVCAGCQKEFYFQAKVSHCAECRSKVEYRDYAAAPITDGSPPAWKPPAPSRTSECPGCGKVDGCVCPDRHLRSTPFEPTTIGASQAPYKCNVPMCGESGVCEECRKRGAR